MTGIVVGLFKVIGITIGTTIGIVGTAGVVLYMTKPEKETFDTLIRNECKETIHKNSKPGNNSIAEKIAGSVYGAVVSMASNVSFSDYIIARVVDVKHID